MKVRVAAKLLGKKARWHFGADGGRKARFEHVQRVRKARKGTKRLMGSVGADLRARLAGGR
jgi:hypothetical protein